MAELAGCGRGTALGGRQRARRKEREKGRRRRKKRKENGKIGKEKRKKGKEGEREREREREGGIRADRGADRDCSRTRIGRAWHGGRWFVTRGTEKERAATGIGHRDVRNRDSSRNIRVRALRKNFELNDENSILKLISARFNSANFGMLQIIS